MRKENYFRLCLMSRMRNIDRRKDSHCIEGLVVSLVVRLGFERLKFIEAYKYNDQD